MNRVNDDDDDDDDDNDDDDDDDVEVEAGNTWGRTIRTYAF